MLTDQGGLPPDSRAVVIRPEFDWQGRQAGFLAVGATGPGYEDVQQPAGREQMRIGEQIAGLADPGPGYLGLLATGLDVLLGQLAQDVLQGRDQPGPLLQTHQVGRQARIRGQFLKGEYLDEPGPLLVRGDAYEQLPVGRGPEDLIDRPGAPARRHWPRIQASGCHAGHVRAHEEGRAFKQGAADTLAAARLLPLAQ